MFPKESIEIVLYHANCLDGFASAFAVWYYYYRINSLDPKSIQYIPINFPKNKDDRLPYNIANAIKDKNVLICDITPGQEYLLQIMKLAKDVMIIDHHKSAEKILPKLDNSQVIFDLKHSAAILTWKWLFDNEEPPYFIKLIGDRDTWSGEYPETNDFICYLREQEHDFDEWLKYLDIEYLHEKIKVGEIWNGYRQALIKKIIPDLIIQTLPNKKQPVIVAYYNSHLFESDIADHLLKKYPFVDFCVIYRYHNGFTYFSLRSEDGRDDVSEIAESCNIGGGHHNAAGGASKGFNGKLPGEIYNDHGLLKAIMRAEEGSFTLDFNTKKYLLVKKYNNEWMEFQDLLREKFKHVDFIIFQKNYKNQRDYVIIQMGSDTIHKFTSGREFKDIDKNFLA